MKSALAVSAYLSLMLVASASAEEPDFGSGHGFMSCAEFATLYTKQPKVVELAFFAWAQGYMTGWNVVSDDRIFQVDLKIWSVEAQQAHVRNYCDAHPLRQYIDAVNDLMAGMKYTDAKTHGVEP